MTPELRGARQEHVSAEITAFTNSIHRNIAELGAISDRALESATRLSEAADHAARRTEAATGASAEASANVRDIASATDELAASVMEIDRQVAQSNTIAEKAVGEAERTNAAVLELSEAVPAYRRRRQSDHRHCRADQPAGAQRHHRSRPAPARPAAALRWWRARSRPWPARPRRPPKISPPRLPACKAATVRSIEAIEAIEATIRDIGSISGAIAAAVTQPGRGDAGNRAECRCRSPRAPLETADEVNRRRRLPPKTRAPSVTSVRAVAEELGVVAHRIRDQIDAFSKSLRAAVEHDPESGPGFRIRSCSNKKPRLIRSRRPPECGAGFSQAPPARRQTGCCSRHLRDARSAMLPPRQAMRCCWRGNSDCAASSSVLRALTSTNTRTSRRRATMSTSPTGVRKRRATMR